MTRAARLRWALACVLLLGTAHSVAHAAELNVGSSVTPAFVRVGEPTRYTAFVEMPPGVLMRPKWLPPDTSAALTWGPLHASKRPSASGRGDTLTIESTIQAFQLGNIMVPGMAFVDEGKPGSAPMQLPAVRLTVLPVLAAGDSAADLKPVRGPLKAPWWEVVPWLWVVAISLAAGAVAWLIMRMRRRPQRIAPVVARHDPSELALSRLADLRARRLPETGEFGVHAVELTAILRRFLEATSLRLRPGFTTSEMSRRLQDESVPAPEAMVLLSLLRVWDRVKFARAPVTLDEARRSEDAVEQFVRRLKRPGSQEAA